MTENTKALDAEAREDLEYEDNAGGDDEGGQDQEPSGEVQDETKYEPTYRYTALGEEREFDDFVKPFVKSKDEEARLRDLYERAAGLDHFKEKVSKRDAELDRLRQEYAKAQREREDLEFLKKTNPAKFFETVGVDPYEYAMQQVRLEEMGEEERKLYTQNSDLITEREQFRRELEELRKERQDLEQQRLKNEFQTALADPDVDVIRKQVNDFEQQVIEYGRIHHRLHGQDLSFKEAVDGVKKRYAHLFSNQPQARPQPTKRRVIPSIGNSAGSSAGQTIKSIDQLKEIYKSRYES